MTFFRSVLLILLMSFTAMGQQNSPREASSPRQVPVSCPVTTPPAVPFTPPTPYERSEGGRTFLLGTEKLWTVMMTSGVWGWGPHKPGHEQDVQPLTTKTFWASTDFDYRNEYPPKLTVTGRRLDGPTQPLLTLTPTNAFPGPTAAMLVGVYVPAPGCWEITGEYRNEKLSFVVWVTPLNSTQ